MIGPLMATVITLTNMWGSVAVGTLGARAVSYVPAGQEEVLARLQDGSGGIALCWPWFAMGGPTGCRRHGVARYHDFVVVRQEESAQCSELVLRLQSNAETRRAFPHDFALTAVFRLEKALTVELIGENTGMTPFCVTEMLHPYFRVGSARECRVAGFDGCTYRDAAHPELGDTRVWQGDYAVSEGARIFAFPADGMHAISLQDPVLGRTLALTSCGDIKTVVWSPGETSARGTNVTSQLASGEWRTFVCVENGTCYADRAYTLVPGERHVLSRTIELLKK